MIKQRLHLLSILAVLLLMAVQSSFADEAEKYRIKIKIGGVSDRNAYLAFHYGDQVIIGDTARIDANGEFEISGDGSLPGGVYRIMMGKRNYFEFLMADEQDFELTTDVVNYINFMKVHGSLENILFNQYQRFLLVQDKKTRRINKQIEKLKKKPGKRDSIKILRKQVKAVEEENNEYRAKMAAENPDCFISTIFNTMSSPDVPEPPKNWKGEVTDTLFELNFTKKHYWNNVDFTDSRLVRTPILHGKVDIWLKNLTFPTAEDGINNVDELFNRAMVNEDVFKYVANQTAKYYRKSNVIGLDAVYVHIADNYLLKRDIAPWIKGEEKQKIRRRLAKMKPNIIGNKAPNIALNDREGNRISMREIDAEYTVVFFWDYECPFCQDSMPRWKSIYNKYKDKGLEFYAVCINTDDPNQWTKYIDQNKLEWINVIGNERARYSQQYNVDGTPTVYLLDKEKKIISKKLKETQLERLLQERLNKTS